MANDNLVIDLSDIIKMLESMWLGWRTIRWYGPPNGTWLHINAMQLKNLLFVVQIYGWGNALHIDPLIAKASIVPLNYPQKSLTL